MRVREAIVDTNVVVSGLLTDRPESPTAQILDAMLRGRLVFVLSVALLAEYRTVLLRRRAVRQHGLSGEEVDSLLTALASNAVIREPAPGATGAPDRGDDHLWALLEHCRAAALVTGDRLLLDNPPAPGRVVGPREFIDAGALGTSDR